MLLFSICRRCPHGNLSLPEYSPKGELEVTASVQCAMEPSGMLFMRSNPPEKCPFKLEHRLGTQDIDPDFADWMSGRRKKDETVVRDS